MQIILNSVPLAFPALDAPQAFGDGEPAYGAKLIIEPRSEMSDMIDSTIDTVAAAKWPERWADILDELTDDNKLCFVKKEYRNKKTRQPYDGFAGKWYLSARNASTQPTIFDRFNNKVEDPRKIAQLIYSGCIVHAMVDIWAQENKWGMRINCSLGGVMFAADGQRFSGAAPATSDTFASYAAGPSIDDLV